MIIIRNPRLSHALSISQQFLRFALVGAGGTTGHYIVLLTLVELRLAAPVPASATGFVVGAIINYFLNREYTFRSSVPHRSGLPKFLTIASIGMALNTSVMALMRTEFELQYVAAQIIATCSVMIWAFVGNRAWTFNDVR